MERKQPVQKNDPLYCHKLHRNREHNKEMTIRVPTHLPKWRKLCTCCKKPLQVYTPPVSFLNCIEAVFFTKCLLELFSDFYDLKNFFHHKGNFLRWLFQNTRDNQMSFGWKDRFYADREISTHCEMTGVIKDMRIKLLILSFLTDVLKSLWHTYLVRKMQLECLPSFWTTL